MRLSARGAANRFERRFSGESAVKKQNPLVALIAPILIASAVLIAFQILGRHGYVGLEMRS
jgi:hypothetical protein